MIGKMEWELANREARLAETTRKPLNSKSRVMVMVRPRGVEPLSPP